MTHEHILQLMNAGLTKQQATSITAETITNLYMDDDGKMLIAEAKRQVDEMRETLRTLQADYISIKAKMAAVSDNILAIMEAQNNFGIITDDKAKNILALYSAILSMNEKHGADPTEAVRNTSFVLYAYLGGQAKREINYLTDIGN